MPTPFREEEGNTTTTLVASGWYGPAQSENPRKLRNNMHENRDISCTSWTTDQDRSANAMNQTADMNVQEKSDCAVVPAEQRRAAFGE
jgi:cytochrome oxidase assembly protein ShyY1